jgi:hypothetical protein
MITRFFPHGGGSGAKVVEYLLAAEVAAYDDDRRRIKGQTVKRDILPEVLAGHAETTQMLIDSNHRKWRYTSGVIAFSVEDAPSEEEQVEVMASFGRAAFAGMDADQTNILWVRHLHMGNVELHFLIPRVELISGRAFNVAPPGAEKYFNAFRDYWNALKGWADPEMLATRKDIRSVIESKDRKSIRETLHTAVVQRIESGEITNHQDLRKYLSGLEGLEIKPLTDKQIEKRARQDALEVATKGEKKRRRDTRITLREISTTGTDTTYRMEGRIYHEDWTAGDYFAAKLAKGSGSESARKPAADQRRIDALRDAMHRAIDRRAQSNRKRYEHVTRRSEKTEPTDPDRTGNGGRISDQKNTDHDERRAVSGNERRSPDGRHHDDITGDLSSRQHDWITDPIQICTNIINASGPAEFATGPGPDGDRWAWNRAGPAEQHRNNPLSNDRAKGTNLSKTTIEEVNNVGHDPTRKRIAALRRSLAEASERQYRTIEFLRCRIEETSKQLQSLRERIDAKLRTKIDRTRGRTAEIITRVKLIIDNGGRSAGVCKTSHSISERDY